MNNPNIAIPDNLDCIQCQTEIPLDAALTPTGAEYVSYYCGSECLDGFLSQAKATANADVMVSAQALL